jgi:hypothetical protein
LIEPPDAAGALAEALALGSPPDADGAALLGVPWLQAAMTALTAGSDRPMTAARLTNWRLVIRPLANDSTRSSSTGVADARDQAGNSPWCQLLLDHVTDP